MQARFHQFVTEFIFLLAILFLFPFDRGGAGYSTEKLWTFGKRGLFYQIY